MTRSGGLCIADEVRQRAELAGGSAGRDRPALAMKIDAEAPLDDGYFEKSVAFANHVSAQCAIAARAILTMGFSDTTRRDNAMPYDWSWVLENQYDGGRVPDGVQREALEDVSEPYFAQMERALARKDIDGLHRLMTRQNAILKRYVAHGFTSFELIQKGLANRLYLAFRGWRRAMIKKVLTCPEADVPRLMEKLEPFTRDVAEFHCDLVAAERCLDHGAGLFDDLRRSARAGLG